MKLNTKQSLTMQKVVEGKNLYIGGQGGVGKSVLIRQIVSNFVDSTVVLAPTGIAAININGATIHSAFRLPFSIVTKKDWGRITEKLERLFSKESPVKRIIIDEVSMVRADVFQAVDQMLRKVRRLNVPFGGLQVIVVGDFYQLSPVVTNNESSMFYKLYSSQYAFGSETWSSAGFEYVELDEVMRQSDALFINHLRNIRMKLDGWQDSIDFFNRHGIQNQVNVLDEDPVFLCTTNASADLINRSNYEELEGKEHVYYAKKNGKFSSEPAPFELRLKFGTKIIITANAKNEGYMNGEVGYVTGFIDDRIEVLLEDGERTVFVEPYKWEEIEYDVDASGNLKKDVVGTFMQYPIKYSWGITVHKSQGQTIKNAIIDVGRGCFCHGQLYVALSRIKSLEGLALMSKVSTNDVIIDRAVHDFYAGGCKGISLF